MCITFITSHAVELLFSSPMLCITVMESFMLKMNYLFLLCCPLCCYQAVHVPFLVFNN